MAATWAKLQHEVEFSVGWVGNVKSIQTAQAKLFSFDLAHMPFRFIGLPKEMIAQRGIPQEHLPEMFKEAFDLLPGKICRDITHIVKWINIQNGLPHGLIFATRPFKLAELFVLAKIDQRKTNALFARNSQYKNPPYRRKEDVIDAKII
jgi:hypothetical protein